MPKKLVLTTFLIINILIGTMMFVTLKASLDSSLGDTTAKTTSNTFFSLQLGQSSPIYSIIVFTIVAIYSNFIWIYSKNNNFFFNIIQRIGYTKFLKKGALYSFLGGSLLSVMMSFYQLSFLTLLIHPLQLNTPVTNQSEGISAFDNGNLWSIVQFTTLAALGWGVYAVFVFAVTLWIKKNVLAMVSGGLLGVLLFVLPALLAQLLQGIGTTFFYPVQISTLLSPGLITYPSIPIEQAASYFPYALLFYALLAIFLMILWVKQKEKKN